MRAVSDQRLHFGPVVEGKGVLSGLETEPAGHHEILPRAIPAVAFPRKRRQHRLRRA
jgi:hypothetical protein